MDRFESIAHAQPFTLTYRIEALDGSGRGWGKGADLVQPSASTRKVGIMMYALGAARAGRIDLSKKLTITAALQDGINSGTYQYMSPGTEYSLRDAIVNMIITSDNVSTQLVLMEVGGADKVTAWANGIGMTGTKLRGLVPNPTLPWDHAPNEVAVTCPADQALLLRRIVKGMTDEAEAKALGVASEECIKGLEIMSWQRLRGMIPFLLPSDTRIDNKTGRSRRGRSDVGVVWKDGKPLFAIAAYADWVPDTLPDGLPGQSGAYLSIAKLTRAAWEELG
ncbi:MAG: class A beta-lactamase-related serine hydrolase [Gemmobacter sp.]|jgi:beta-lactamase class A|nr:class A beta-lactamase-related serine hydrolase [Gemmobacter sp.]